MQIIGICRDGEILRNIREVLILAGCHLHHFSKEAGFLLGLRCPHTSIQIGSLLLQQVVRHHAELQAGTSAKKQDRVALGNLKQLLEQSYGFVHDRLKILGTMTYLHQTETRTFEIQTCRGCSLNHFARQDTWSRIEIVLFHVILFVVYLISIS